MRWQKHLQQAITEPRQLLELLKLSKTDLAFTENNTRHFSLLASESFVARIKKEDTNDPLLKQIYPCKSEDIKTQEYIDDPVGDLKSEIFPGLLHKYHGRVLLITTGACPIHCRYCFRRNFPYQKSSISNEKITSVLEYLKKHKEVTEVILSGGDPFMLSDDKLRSITKQLASIQHLKRLRIHSRTPIALPQRIMDANLDWLENSRLNPVLVVHCNHYQEIDDSVARAINRFINMNIPVFNQSVLLKDINDDVEILAELSEKLFELRVMPYYLHQLDQVAGTKHFKVNEIDAITIVHELKKRLPGYLVPALVKEIEGEPYKIPM